jgi:hypothetical protein
MTVDEFIATLTPYVVREPGEWDRVVALVRSDMAKAIDAGILPNGTKLSIRQSRQSGSLLVIEITRWDGAVLSDAALERVLEGGADPCARSVHDLTPALVEAMTAIHKIVDRIAYDPDWHSRIRFDIHADAVVALATRWIETERDASLVALQVKAREAANAVGKKATKSLLRGAPIEACDRDALERLIDVADKAKGRPVVYDRWRALGWRTESRMFFTQPRGIGLIWAETIDDLVALYLKRFAKRRLKKATMGVGWAVYCRTLISSAKIEHVADLSYEGQLYEPTTHEEREAAAAKGSRLDYGGGAILYRKNHDPLSGRTLHDGGLCDGECLIHEPPLDNETRATLAREGAFHAV